MTLGLLRLPPAANIGGARLMATSHHRTCCGRGETPRFWSI